MDVRKRPAGVSWGYADNAAQSDALARMARPIQGWYLTATADLDGNTTIDAAKASGRGVQVRMFSPDPPGYIDLYIPTARTVSGSRLGDGAHSTFHHVFIVAEPARLLDHEIGALADYVALLALTRLSTTDVCQPLPSIVNLLAKDCAQPAAALTVADLAYLHGLYRMTPGSILRTQQDEIIFQMQAGLDGK